jgi:hypothetical protein
MTGIRKRGTCEDSRVCVRDPLCLAKVYFSPPLPLEEGVSSATALQNRDAHLAPHGYMRHVNNPDALAALHGWAHGEAGDDVVVVLNKSPNGKADRSHSRSS